MIIMSKLSCYCSWRDIVDRSIVWPSLYLRHENRTDRDEPWTDFFATTSRRFKKVTVNEMLELNKNRYLELFTNIGSYICELSLFYCVPNDENIFLEILKTMPNLKKVNCLHTVLLFGEPSDGNVLPAFSKLETLEMVLCEYNVMKCFKQSQLKCLKVLSSMDKNRQSPTPLIEFLRTQNRLTTLALHSFKQDESQLFQAPVLEDGMPFRLKKLSLMGIKLRESPNDYNNLLHFMKSHAKTVEELELGRKFPDFVYEFIMSKFTKLNTLRLMANELPKEMEFYQRLEENKSIKFLVVVDSPPPDHTNNGSAWLKEFFKHMPNVESISLLDYIDRDTIQFIAGNFTKLKQIWVRNFDGSIFNGIRFPSSLMSLNLKQFDDTTDWNGFTRDNPGITELYIATVYDPDNLDIHNIIKNLKLHSLKIDGEINGDKNFFDAIRQNCSDLKKLDIDENSLSLDISEVSELPLRLREEEWNGRLIFNSESAFWNQEDYNGELPGDEEDNWNPDANEWVLDPFDMHLLMGNFDIEDEFDDNDDYDDDDDMYDGYDDYENYHPDDY